MGCAAALEMAAGGMRPIVLEQSDIGQGASGVNAGTLSLQIKRVKLMPYALCLEGAPCLGAHGSG